MKKYYLSTLIILSAPNLVLALGAAQSSTNSAPQQATAPSAAKRKRNAVRHPRGPKTWFPKKSYGKALQHKKH